MNYYVAFLDILGFKQLILNRPLETIVESVERLWPQILRVSASLGDMEVGPRGDYIVKEAKRPVSYVMFSDSIIFYAEDDPHSVKVPENFLSLVWCLSLALALGFSGKLPLRGALSYGEFYGDPDKSIFVGRALVEAYDYERRQEWSGVSFCPSLVDEMARREVDMLRIPCVSKYAVPFKNGRQEIPAINWTPIISNPASLESVFWHDSREVRAKARNTIEYYDYCNENGLTKAYDWMEVEINVKIDRRKK
jgi:hypothetical protein